MLASPPPITGLSHAHALCMTQHVVRIVYMPPVRHLLPHYPATDPLAGFKGPTCKGREGRGKGGEGRDEEKGKGREGEREGETGMGGNV